MGDFRFDVAPQTLQPHLSPAQATAAFDRSPAATYAKDAGVHAVMYFGLFTGSDAIVGPPPDKTLMGNRPIDALPAWLIVVTGVDTSSWAMSAPPDAVTSPASSPTSVRGPYYAMTVVSDTDGNSPNFGSMSMGPGDPGIG